MSKRSLLPIWLLAVLLAMSACRAPATREPPYVPGIRAPYPASRAITGVRWDFNEVGARAIGSDMWPCTWARDDNEYCAWGDGGGFDGNDDHIGRVSLGIARIAGAAGGDTLTIAGKNVWGEPPYAEHAATFGGKVDSLISVDGVLYASGGVWTKRNDPDPVHKSGGGPVNTLLWSKDLGARWQIASWSTPGPLGSFLNFGRDNAGALDGYVYLYYVRDSDDRHVFLKRVPKDRLLADPTVPGTYQFLTGVDGRGRPLGWSDREADAGAIFFDPNHVEGPEVVFDARLHRFLLTVGHYASGVLEDASITRLGIFESRHPWGPWATVGYYEDWGGFKPSAGGDYLGLRIPAKWMSPDGKTLWCIYSGLHELDSFNVVKGTLKTAWWQGM